MHPELLVRKRMLTALLALLVLFGLVTVRVGQLTILEKETLTARGVSQWTKEGVITARRGDITDCHGSVLAISATTAMVCADPRLVKDEERFLDAVTQVLPLDRETARKKLADKTKGLVILKRQVDRAAVDQLRSLKSEAEEGAGLAALTFEEDAGRWYPQGTCLSQVLGLTNVDSAGQSGLESQYDDVLAGVSGSYLHQADARSRLLGDSESWYIASQPGDTLRLTIDADIQQVCEKAMRECLEVNSAASVLCLVSEVRTGAILGMCMYPCYDPNDPPRSDMTQLTELMRITAISDVYEPGSTFKIITAAAALDSGATTPEDQFYCSAKITVDGDTIKCWGRPHGAETMAEGIQNSCNPVFVELALRMGTDTFYRYLTAFGLGRKTGIDLPGESPGLLIGSRYVKNVDLARIGFGQSIAVTPLQLMMAANAAVNGGKLMKPRIVAEIRDREGTVLQRNDPQVVATPITEETSATLRSLLENVVTKGGGKNAAVAGYRVGGKTGTAQVYKDGRIVRDKHIGSFYGFVPADDPQLSVLVVVKEAETPIDYGGTTAAPFARQILEGALAVRNIPPESAENDAEVAVPDVTGLTISAARRTLTQAGLETITDGGNAEVAAQLPRAGATLRTGGHVMLYTDGDDGIVPEELTCVPDMLGLSDMDCARLARNRGFEIEMSGTGACLKQTPAAGTYASPGDTIHVTLGAAATP